MADYPNFAFDISFRDPTQRARTGRLSTPHGALDTPNFIFCATKAAIKGLTIAQMREAGADFILGNTYHLMIQPGAELVEAMGGLHAFTGWEGPMLTDSGGFQIFSMGYGSVADEIKGRKSSSAERTRSLLKITEDGAKFRSYRRRVEAVSRSGEVDGHPAPAGRRFHPAAGRMHPVQRTLGARRLHREVDGNEPSLGRPQSGGVPPQR